MKFIDSELGPELSRSKPTQRDFIRVLNNLDQKSMINFRRNLIFRILTASIFLLMAEDYNEGSNEIFKNYPGSELEKKVSEGITAAPSAAAVFFVLLMTQYELYIRKKTVEEKHLKTITENRMPNIFIALFFTWTFAIAYHDQIETVYSFISENLKLAGRYGSSDMPQDMNSVIYLNTPSAATNQLFGYYLTGSTPQVFVENGRVIAESMYTADSTEYETINDGDSFPYPINATLLFESSYLNTNIVLPIKVINGTEVYTMNSTKVETYDADGNIITLENGKDYEVRRYPDGTHRLFIINSEYIGTSFLVSYSMYHDNDSEKIEFRGEMPKLSDETIEAIDTLLEMVSENENSLDDPIQSMDSVRFEAQYDRDLGDQALVADTLLDYINNLISQEEKGRLQIECENAAYLATLVAQASEQVSSDLTKTLNQHVALGYSVGEIIQDDSSGMTWTGLGNVGHAWNMGADGNLYDFTPAEMGPNRSYDSRIWLHDKRVSSLGIENLRKEVLKQEANKTLVHLKGVNWGELGEYISNLGKSLILIASLVLITKKFGMRLLSVIFKQLYLSMLNELELIVQVRKYLENPKVTDPMYSALNYLISAQYRQDGGHGQDTYQDTVDALYPSKSTSNSLVERMKSMFPNSHDADENKSDRIFWYLSMVDNTSEAFTVARENILRSGMSNRGEVSKALDDLRSIQSKFVILRRKKRESEQRRIAESELDEIEEGNLDKT